MGKDSPTLTGRAKRVVQVPSLASPPAQKPGPRAQALRIQRPGSEPAVVTLEEGQRYLLGRHDAADIGFDDGSVSRLHGVLLPTADGWTFEDHGSSNGSVLLREGQEPYPVAAHASIPVGVGDTIELGDGASSLTLLSDDEDDEPSKKGGDPTCRSRAAKQFQEKLAIAARTRVPVFLLGPSGCGKTHAARQIHLRSAAHGAFVPVNCARLNSDASALHSELLGHVKGAFTGADAPRTGKLFHADGGTLFLDEVESLPHMAQGFLLDVLEGTGDLAPLGAKTPRLSAPVFRLISASKVPLAESGLRDDLCERLAEGHLWRVPDLADRADDIPGLMDVFATGQSSLLGVKIELSKPAVRAATSARWPGQIRQLRATVNVLAQMAVARLPLDEPLPERIRVGREELDRHLAERAEAFGERGSPSSGSAPGAAPPPLRRKADARSLTREHLIDILEEVSGNQSEAARRLGIARNTLARKLREFDLR